MKTRRKTFRRHGGTGISSGGKSGNTRIKNSIPPFYQTFRPSVNAPHFNKKHELIPVKRGNTFTILSPARIIRASFYLPRPAKRNAPAKRLRDSLRAAFRGVRQTTYTIIRANFMTAMVNAALIDKNTRPR
jgi:hypothetical protein